MTFNFWVMRWRIVLKSALKCNVLSLNFSWNHLWSFLTHITSSWVHLKTFAYKKYSLKYSQKYILPEVPVVLFDVHLEVQSFSDYVTILKLSPSDLSCLNPLKIWGQIWTFVLCWTLKSIGKCKLILLILHWLSIVWGIEGVFIISLSRRRHP